MGAHPRVARFEKIHLLLPVHKRDVRQGVHEFFGIINHPVAHRVAPEIFRMLELLENLDGLRHIHLAIRAAIGRVAQLANPRVAGAGVVPAIGTFLRQFLGYFV